MAIIERRSWDLAWEKRPKEEAANFNPAFCGELLSRSVGEYKRIREQPFPFPLTFVVLPIALHQKTRDLLPGNSSASFVAWAAEQKPFLSEIPERTVRLIPITREALLFSMQHQLVVVEQGGLIPGKKRIGKRNIPALSTDDANEARSAAALLGRWFANQGSTSSIMHGFGVTP